MKASPKAETSNRCKVHQLWGQFKITQVLKNLAKQTSRAMKIQSESFCRTRFLCKKIPPLKLSDKDSSWKKTKAYPHLVSFTYQAIRIKRSWNRYQKATSQNPEKKRRSSMMDMLEYKTQTNTCMRNNRNSNNNSNDGRTHTSHLTCHLTCQLSSESNHSYKDLTIMA